MKYTEVCQALQRAWHKSCLLCLIKKLTPGIHQSSPAVITAVIRRMQQNELIQIMPGWERGESATIILNISEEDDSLVVPHSIPCCYVPFLKETLTFLLPCWDARWRNPFLFTQKGEQRGVSLCTLPCLFGSHWDASPPFQAWSLPEHGGWDIEKGQGLHPNELWAKTCIVDIEGLFLYMRQWIA